MSNGDGQGFWPTWKSNKLFTLVLTILFAYGIVLLGSLIQLNLGKWNRLGKADIPSNAITISGTGKVTGTPDIAVADLGLQTRSPDVQTAQRENTEKMNAFIEALKKLGVAAKDIQTSQYSINPQYRYDKTEQRSVIDGYQVRQSVEVKIRELTKISAVLGKAGELGMNEVEGLRFSIDDPEDLKNDARAKALLQARGKAQSIAASLGVRMTRVIGFDESSGGGFPPPVPYRAYAEGIGGGEFAAPQIETGSLDVTVNVSVTYEIE